MDAQARWRFDSVLQRLKVKAAVDAVEPIEQVQKLLRDEDAALKDIVEAASGALLRLWCQRGHRAFLALLVEAEQYLVAAQRDLAAGLPVRRVVR